MAVTIFQLSSNLKLPKQISHLQLLYCVVNYASIPKYFLIGEEVQGIEIMQLLSELSMCFTR